MIHLPKFGLASILLAAVLPLSGCWDRDSLGASSDGSELAVSCNLPDRFVHRTNNDGDRDLLASPSAIAFFSNYAVNTDGSIHSYHRDDPFGTKRLAMNTICNGAYAYSVAGQRVGPSRCRRLVRLYEKAKAKNWLGRPFMRFYGVATKDSEKRVPCIIEGGEYDGHFVSSTSLTMDESAGVCDPPRYLDSLEIPFIIVPNHRNFVDRNVGVGDLAVVYHPSSGRMTFAVIGDTGPAGGLGEGSVKVLQLLKDTQARPHTLRDTYAFGINDVFTIQLPQDGISPPYTADRINAAGSAAFEKFGGRVRMNACITELRQ